MVRASVTWGSSASQAPTVVGVVEPVPVSSLLGLPGSADPHPARTRTAATIAAVFMAMGRTREGNGSSTAGSGMETP